MRFNCYVLFCLFVFLVGCGEGTSSKSTQSSNNGKGYAVVCMDGTVSQSGGIQGACSHHGGVRTTSQSPSNTNNGTNSSNIVEPIIVRYTIPSDVYMKIITSNYNFDGIKNDKKLISGNLIKLHAKQDEKSIETQYMYFSDSRNYVVLKISSGYKSESKDEKSNPNTITTNGIVELKIDYMIDGLPHRRNLISYFNGQNYSELMKDGFVFRDAGFLNAIDTVVIRPISLPSVISPSSFFLKGSWTSSSGDVLNLPNSGSIWNIEKTRYFSVDSIGGGFDDFISQNKFTYSFKRSSSPISSVTDYGSFLLTQPRVSDYPTFYYVGNFYITKSINNEPKEVVLEFPREYVADSREPSIKYGMVDSRNVYYFEKFPFLLKIIS